MFKELSTLLKSTTLCLTISTESDGNLRVVLMPKAKEGENPALSTPLLLVDTAEELDANFARIVTGYTISRESLDESLSASLAVMEAAKKQSTKEAAEKIAGKVKGLPAKGESSVPSAGTEGAKVGDESSEEETGTNVVGNSDIDLF